MEKTYADEIKEKITKQDTITVSVSFPKDVYRNFKRWAKEYASDCYWLAIERLLTYHNTTEFDTRLNLKILSDRDEALLERVYILEQTMDSLLQEDGSDSKNEIKTFGSDRNE